MGWKRSYLLAATVTRFVQNIASKTANQTILYRFVPPHAIRFVTVDCYHPRSQPADIAQAGVEESRKEEALHTASWLVFWANGPIQAHDCFCGDELAVRDSATYSLGQRQLSHGYL